ncbi:hypothetical protein GQ54DRAFT_290183 [Martensiomyces pterosporus]|nr:hypothetical protein GQ54DRAFT_290183 [Martensiomyces pterosporus]
MKPISALLTVACSALAVIPSVHGKYQPDEQAQQLFSYADITGNFVGALLIKNSLATSCECIPIDSMAAFVAASCFDYSSGQLNETTKYEVSIDNNKITTRAQLPIEKIHIHPAYDPNTIANNIAVVEFNTHGTVNWTNQIAVDRNSWADVIYVRRSLRDITASVWNNPQVAEHTETDDDCRASSGLFAANQGDFLCGNWTVQGIPNSNACSIPFGSLYSVSGKRLAVAGLYSHTVIYGDNICAYRHQLSYYTLLSNYTAFANSVLRGHTVNTYTSNLAYKTNASASYKMNTGTATNIKGTTTMSGDLFPRVGVLQQLMSPGVSAAPSLSTGSATPTSTGVNSSAARQSSSPAMPTLSVNPATAGSSSNGLSRGETIAVATVVPILSIAIIVALFFSYRVLKKRRNAASWDPLGERSNISAQTLARELGGASVRQTVPPNYADIEFIDALAGNVPKQPLPEHQP